MKEHPILFSTPMVQAILNGTKSQTRRVVKPQPKVVLAMYTDKSLETNCIFRKGDQRIHCPYGQVGSKLWVRETWRVGAWHEEKGIAVDYKADNYCRKEWLAVDNGELFERLWRESTDEASEVYGFKSRYKWESGQSPCRWRHSIFMPRWASRITLEITDIRVQRLWEITDEDAKAEGIGATEPLVFNDSYKDSYAWLWDKINKKHVWILNEWVWVISFKRVQ